MNKIVLPFLLLVICLLSCQFDPMSEDDFNNDMSHLHLEDMKSDIEDYYNINRHLKIGEPRSFFLEYNQWTEDDSCTGFYYETPKTGSYEITITAYFDDNNYYSYYNYVCYFYYSENYAQGGFKEQEGQTFFLSGVPFKIRTHNTNPNSFVQYFIVDWHYKSNVYWTISVERN